MAALTDLRRGQVVGDASRRWVGGNAISHAVGDATYLEKAGGTMTGPLILAHDPAVPLEAATKQYVDTHQTVHRVRVSTASGTLNGAVANGAVLQFDTVAFDSDGYAPTTATFDRVIIPAGLGGTYILAAWSSTTANQSTTMGMGILINGSQAFSETNQAISGPASISYTLDNGAVELGQLNAGDYLQLINNSVSAGANVFRSVTLSLARLEPSGPAGPPGTGATPSTPPPVMDGVAFAGAATGWSRGDHVHPRSYQVGSGLTLNTGTTPPTINATVAGTVTSVAGGTGITVSPSPITGAGTVSLTAPVAVSSGGTGTTTALTAGSVVFAGPSGVYSQDNANLFWDDTNNRLGIGTALPSHLLHVNGGLRAPNIYASTLWDESGNARLALAATENQHFSDQHRLTNAANSVNYAYFNSGGSYNVSGAWIAISARELKEEIAPYARGLDAIMQLNPVVFRYRAGTQFARSADEPSALLLGLIAEEVEPVMPELVGETAAAIGKDEVVVATLTPGNAIYAVINSIKELAARLDALEAKVA